MRPWKSKFVSLGIVGFSLIALGTALCFLRLTIFHTIIQKGLALTPTARSFDIWRDTSSLPPIRMNIYFFNWTNPHELHTPGKKPHFVETGPYSFREIRIKDNVTFHPENKTVSYWQRRIWHFDAEHTKGSLNDTIIQLNVVAASAAHKVRYWDYGMQKSLSILMAGTNYYVTKTVNELTFAGYSDSLLTMGKMLSNEEGIIDRFGWFYMRNDSSDMDGHFNMETGEDDISRLGIMRNWNFKDTVKYYKSPCNIIEGSAGQFWPPGRTKDDISIFSVELCRSMIFEYERTVSHLGIEGYQYSIDKKTLGNAAKRRYPHEQVKFLEPTTTTEDFFMTEQGNEITGFSTTTESFSENDESIFKNTDDEFPDDDPDVINVGKCYCNGECAPSGLVNVTACRYGAPVFISLPHFYKTDSDVLDQVEGLNPDENEHSFTITLEPITGIPLEVIARLQANILLHSSELVSLFNDMPTIYMPILWFDIKVALNDEMAATLKQLLILPILILCTGIVMMIIGLCLIVAVIYFANKQHMSSPSGLMEKIAEEPLEKKSETVYMDKINANEDTNVRSDRRLYTNLY